MSCQEASSRRSPGCPATHLDLIAVLFAEMLAARKRETSAGIRHPLRLETSAPRAAGLSAGRAGGKATGVCLFSSPCDDIPRDCPEPCRRTTGYILTGAALVGSSSVKTKGSGDPTPLSFRNARSVQCTRADVFGLLSLAHCTVSTAAVVVAEPSESVNTARYS